MTGDPIEEVLDRWSRLDADWRGVPVGVTILALVGLFGVSVPW